MVISKNQFNNAIYSAKAVLSAKRIGCCKFVNAGTLEETFTERFIKNGEKNVKNISTQTDYVISKLASRDMCKMVSYLEKIDYIHTRLSVPLDPNLKNGGYISYVFSNIIKDEPYEKPKNTRLFDIILTEDVAVAYYLIGLKGKNKADYFIGTSEPKTLLQYFELFEKSKRGAINNLSESNTFEGRKIFSTDNLVNDTGFELSNNFENIIKKINLS